MRVEELLSRLDKVHKTGPDSWEARCPSHEDKKPSLTVSAAEDGKILAHCHVGCTVESVCSSLGIKVSDLFPEEKRNGHNGHEKARIVATYPYHDEDGRLLFEAVRFEPKDFRQRRPDKSSLTGWTWSTKGTRRVLFRLPEIVKAVANKLPILLCEGEKDVLALVKLGFEATCNAGGAGSGKWLDAYNESLRGATIFILGDNDAPGQQHARLIAEKLKGVAGSVHLAKVPPTHKDISDYIAAGAGVEEVTALLDKASEPEAEPEPVFRLTIRRPDELLNMEFDDSDLILGDRLLAKGQSLTMLGAGGIGKSRLLLQLAICCITGRDFLGFVTRGKGLRWLILQTENSNRRLKFDLGKLRDWIGEADWREVNDKLLIHTVETDDDGLLSFDNPENVSMVEELVEGTTPDLLGFDPLNAFAIGDLNKDSDMRNTVATISRVTRKGNPDRCPVVLHHALTGKAGASRATGYDRASFGRNSKVLQAWTRGQINVAAGSPDDNDSLVFSCGKCSNGKEFPTFAARLNPSTMLYEVDPGFDLAAWEAEVQGTKSTGTLVTVDLVADLCKGAMTKKDLARAIMDDTGCVKQYAYRKIKEAEKARKISFSNATERYVKR